MPHSADAAVNTAMAVEQDPLAAETVAEPAGGRDEDRQADQEGDGDAVDGRGAHPEVAADSRQGDVDDRRRP